MVVRLSALRTSRFLPPEIILVLISVRRKTPMTPSGIEPATFRFVEQHLKLCATAVPHFFTAMVYVSKPVWHIPLLCVQWKSPDDGQRNCPKHVEFYSKNKFEKVVHLVGFIIRILIWSCCLNLCVSVLIMRSCCSASSWFYYKNLSRCTVTWTSN